MDSQERLRGLRIAQVCQINNSPRCSQGITTNYTVAQAIVHLVECTKNAQIAAQEAKKHARDAELLSDSAQRAIQKLEKLLQSGMTGETLESLQAMLRAAEVTASGVDE
jgi:hypothetical protein